MTSADASRLPAGIIPEIRDVDLASTDHVHLVGAGGAGMSAIGAVLRSLGHRVTGSDLKDSHSVATLMALGAEVNIGHDAANIESSVDVVARSTAIPDHNAEIIAANEASIPVASRAAILTAITKLKSSIAVAGTHGKTTTSSMLALLLRHADRMPSFIIGGEVNEIGSGAVWESGEHLVVEADESDGTFLVLDAQVAIVTSVEPDHLDLYGDAATVRLAFEEFLAGVDGPRVVCIDDPDGAAVAATCETTTYGTSAEARYRITDFTQDRSSSTFTIAWDDDGQGREQRIELSAPGLHNARNATAAFVCALELGVSAAVAAAGLARYAGVARRFDFRGEAGGITFVDDYAHLPSEVEVTLDAAAGGEWERIVAVFQPHRFTRTAALGADFGPAFAGADIVAVTDIYSAGEAAIPGVSGKLVADAIAATTPDVGVVWLPHRVDLVDWLRNELRTGDLCLTLGAGDLTSLPDQMIALLGDRA